MTGPRLLTRAGIAASILAHLALIVWLVFGTGVRPFAPTSAEAITVDLVAEPPKPKDEMLDLTPILDLSDKLEQAEPITPPPEQPSAPSSAAAPQAPAQQQQAPPSPSESAAPAPPPSPSAAASAAPEPPPPSAEPDLTVKYGTMFGLSDSGFDPDAAAAKIQRSVVDSFRAHLKTCSSLPGELSAEDPVKIVLRVVLQRNGRLAVPPALIEASASAKGPVLMRSAMAALEACQPYTMLPADKYDEWKVLDLGFTPRDFKGG